MEPLVIRGRNRHGNPYQSVDFRGGRAPGPNDVFIAVMGVTGSGKSSFISLCARKRVEIGHTLGARASVVDVYAYELPDRTMTVPRMRKGSGMLAAISDGESHGGALAWIARYNDGTWDTSEGLLERYEHLGEQITSRGFQKLEMCVLGPGNAYYARWQDGSWACHGESEYRNAIRTYSSIDDGSTILNLALGYGGSYVISYGRRDDMRRIKSVWNLCGHYEHLAKFLENNHDISIAALALDPTTNTSYVIIFEETNSVGRWHTRWYGIRRLEKPVRDWWHKAG